MTKLLSTFLLTALLSIAHADGYFIGSNGSSGSSGTSTVDAESASSCETSKPTATSIEIDCRRSTYGEGLAGGAMGIHGYQLNRLVNVLDPMASSTAVPIIAGPNVTLTNGTYSKLSTTNAWDASIESSSAVIDASTQDGMISWEVESSSGTVREMAGFAYDASLKPSYTNLKYAIYQVNHNSMRVYESGSQKFVGTFTVTAGDRLGIMIESGVVTYVYIIGQVVTPFYESKTLASGPLEFQASFNRGLGSSGHSVMGDVRLHSETKKVNVSAKIAGAAISTIDMHDRAELEEIGLTSVDGATYGFLTADRIQTNRFSGDEDIDLSHWYAISRSQTLMTISP